MNLKNRVKSWWAIIKWYLETYNTAMDCSTYGLCPIHGHYDVFAEPKHWGDKRGHSCQECEIIRRNSMGGEANVENPFGQPKPKQTILLMCKCGDCTHWEIGKDFILCKTCRLEFKATVVVLGHDQLVWEEHQR